MKTYTWAIIIVLIVAGLFTYSAMTPGKYDTFATCLKDKGATFFGAFWCPHCQNQKKLFGKSASKLQYVECSTPDGQQQLPVCIEKKVASYPTWEFADGSRLTGEVALATLAEKTSCVLP
ncbi:MAG TPA: thioredoxin domain-containing protein [Candidatus Paceibacterota bacterium]